MEISFANSYLTCIIIFIIDGQREREPKGEAACRRSLAKKLASFLTLQSIIEIIHHSLRQSYEQRKDSIHCYNAVHGRM